MPGEKCRCPECGRFAEGEYLKKNGSCEKCDERAFDELTEEELELYPAGAQLPEYLEERKRLLKSRSENSRPT